MRPSRFITALVILLAALAVDRHFRALVVAAAARGEEHRVRFEDFPPAVGPWLVDVEPLERGEVEMLAVDDYLHANFSNAVGQQVRVYVGYYANPDRATQHPPTICYPGSGWTKTYENSSRFEVPGLADSLPVNVTVFEKDGLSEIVIYWYSLAGYTGADASWQKIARVKRILSGRPITGASKIQIAMKVETTREAAEERLESFLAEFLPVLDRFIPGDKADGS
jgi:EpsI family protein